MHPGIISIPPYSRTAASHTEDQRQRRAAGDRAGDRGAAVRGRDRPLADLRARGPDLRPNQRVLRGDRRVVHRLRKAVERGEAHLQQVVVERGDHRVDVVPRLVVKFLHIRPNLDLGGLMRREHSGVVPPGRRIERKGRNRHLHLPPLIVVLQLRRDNGEVCVVFVVGKTHREMADVTTHRPAPEHFREIADTEIPERQVPRHQGPGKDAERREVVALLIVRDVPDVGDRVGLRADDEDYARHVLQPVIASHHLGRELVDLVDAITVVGVAALLEYRCTAVRTQVVQRLDMNDEGDALDVRIVEPCRVVVLA